MTADNSLLSVEGFYKAVQAYLLIIEIARKDVGDF